MAAIVDIVSNDTVQELADVCNKLEAAGLLLHTYGEDNKTGEKAMRFYLGRLSEELDRRINELRQLVSRIEGAQRMTKDNKGE